MSRGLRLAALWAAGAPLLVTFKYFVMKPDRCIVGEEREGHEV